MEKLMFVFFFVCFASFSSCKTEPVLSLETTDLNETALQETTAVTQSPFTFVDVVLKGDTLIAKVQYSGGCGNHTFEIEKNGFLMKSLPPKQPIKIIHRSDEDSCRALILEELKFYIGDFKGTPTGTTVLLLENWNQHLIYSY
ncbi:MAG: hypothetical protein P8L64_03520 [Flavobacteriales bacterium]|jgi:hypothetical protein|nr:hypothetical protein [Flavobacteriales bacterium]